MLLNQALAAARPDPVGDSDELLGYVGELMNRPEPLVFETAAAWCASESAAEQRLGARILSELGVGAEPTLPFRTESLQVLRLLLADPKPPVVAAAVVALGRLGLAEDLSLVLPLVRHNAMNVRHAVAVALGGHEIPGAIDALIALSDDESPEVRNWAVFGLGTQCDVDTPGLRKALWARVDDSHEETRDEALLGLARRSDRGVVGHVRAALRAEFVATLSVEAAAELAAPELLPALEQLRESWNVSPTLLAEAIVKCGGIASSQLGASE